MLDYIYSFLSFGQNLKCLLKHKFQRKEEINKMRFEL